MPKIYLRASSWSFAQLFVLVIAFIALSFLTSLQNYSGAGSSVCILASIYIGVTLLKICKVGPRAGLVEVADLILAFLLVTMSLVLLAAIADIHNTKLMRLGLSGYLGIDQFANAYTLWCLAIIVALAMTNLRVSIRSSSAPIRHIPTINSAVWNTSTAVVLATLGLAGVSTISFTGQQEAFITRGQDSGNGLQALLYWASSVYVAYVIISWKRSASKFFLILAFLYSVLLFMSANRSPMALIFIAVLIRVILDGRHRVLKFGALLTPLVFLVFAYQSTWRGMVARGAPAGPSDVLTAVIRDPLNAIQRVGFDSIDGMVLAQSLLDKGFPAQYFDPLLSILNFVPRQLWEDKPVLLGSTIGQDFLGLTAGGIFISGPGYFSLVTGSLMGGTILFIASIAIAKHLIIRFGSDAVLSCAILYFIARFPLAGDAFDIFLTLQIVVIYFIAQIPSRYLSMSRKDRLVTTKV